ncbi:mucin-2-like [Physella acuta]|uniref:mucin-2-like n=1 Tax=Physella acuta TaxID=109671 RepID=UPI0027DD2A92|nr:mucin-2-like [Physella acuta]
MFHVNDVFNANTGLERFVVWHQQQKDIPPSDHYMLFTGMEVEEFTGRAYMSSACTPFGVSIIKSTVDGLVGLIAAHELGHSLSASHDANTDSCRDDDQYIMSTVSSSSVDPSNEGNPWRFSPCSIKAFKTYLQITDCTLPEKTKQSNVLPSGPSPGQVLTKDEQCARSSRDSGSHYCKDVQQMNGGEHLVCSGMFCSSVDDSTFCYITLPLEHTACGDNMWCYAGHCVSNLSTQATSEPEAAGTATTADVTQNTSLAPPDGTASPPDGTAAPPDGTAAPPDGTAAPPDGTAAPPDGTAAPPDGTAAPPDGTAAPPSRTAAPPDGTADKAANPTTANPTTANPTTANPTSTNPPPTQPKEIPTTNHDPDRPTTEPKLKNHTDTTRTCSLEMQQIQNLTTNNSMNLSSKSVSYSSAEQSNNMMTRQQTDYILKLQQQQTSTDKTGSTITNSQIFQFSFHNQFDQSNQAQSLTIHSVQSMQPAPGSTQQNVQPVNQPIQDNSLGQASNIKHGSNLHQPLELHLPQPDNLLQALQSQLSKLQQQLAQQPDNPLTHQPDNPLTQQPDNPQKSNIFGSIPLDGCAMFIYLRNLDGWMSCKNLLKTPETEQRSGQPSQ